MSAMNRYERLSLTIQALALAGVVSVFWQANIITSQMERAAIDSLFSSTAQLDELFVEHSELMPYFENGEDIGPGESGYWKVVAMADSLFDYFEHLWEQSEHIPELKEGGPGWKAWLGYIDHVFANSPIMRKRFETVRPRYTENFASFIEERIAKTTSR